MNDIVLQVQQDADGEAPEISYADIVNTYKAICEHRAPVAKQATAGQ